jgi:outer membrane protein
MRSYLMAFCLMITFLALGSAVQAEEGKFGVVDVDQVLNSIDEGKAAKEELVRKTKEAEETLIKMYESFEKEKKAFQKRVESHAVKDEVLQMEQLDLVEQQTEIQTKQKKLETKVQMMQEQLVAPLTRQILDLIQEIGKEGEYTMIFVRGAGGLLYTRESIDLTDEVIERFNNKKD